MGGEKEAEVFEIIFTLVLVFTAYRLGSMRSTNIDITKQTAHMQDLIDKAYEKRDLMKRQWLDAEEKAETWQRRYWNLTSELESEEDGFGSGDDGSHEGSERPNQLQEN